MRSGALLAAGVILFALAAIHSVLGELLIFRHLGEFEGFPKLRGSDRFAKRAVRFTWHLPSLMASASGVILAAIVTIPAVKRLSPR